MLVTITGQNGKPWVPVILTILQMIFFTTYLGKYTNQEK